MSAQIPPKKILAVKLRSLGDIVLMTAPLEELRAHYPKAELHVVCTSAWIPVLQGHPGITKLWPYERRKNTASRAKAITRLALKLRKEGFDWGVNFHASPSSAILTFASGAKTRSIHFHGHQDKNRYSTVSVPGKGVVKPIIERDMDTLRALGLQIPEGKLPLLRLTDAEKNRGREILEEKKLSGPVLAMSLGASRPTKIWPIERFAEVATRWCQDRHGSVVVISGPDEAELRNRFQAALPKNSERILLPTDLSLRELSGVLSQCKGFVGNDSGPKHMSVALGVPTVTLVGPEDPFEWHPYQRDLHPYLYVKDLTCRKDALPGRPPWCGLKVCTVEQHRCMTLISVDQVCETLEDLLKKE